MNGIHESADFISHQNLNNPVTGRSLDPGVEEIKR
jgi:hypothetical protein